MYIFWKITEDNESGLCELTPGDTGLLSHSYSVDANKIRDTFCDYFNSPEYSMISQHQEHEKMYGCS